MLAAISRIYPTSGRLELPSEPALDSDCLDARLLRGLSFDTADIAMGAFYLGNTPDVAKNSTHGASR